MKDKATFKAPGKAHREGITLLELLEMFPDEETATRWFESIIWGDDRFCGKCGSTETKEVPNAKPMPYWCKDCRSYFSVRTGTAIARSNVPLQKWAIAMYLCLTSRMSISSMKLHRDIGVSQPTAWFMLHRIREAWQCEGNNDFGGPVEVDETFMGGRDRNKHNDKRSHVQGPSGKDVVVGMKDRKSNKVVAKRVSGRDKETVHGFIRKNVSPEAKVYTDDHRSYSGLPNHESVNHSVGEWVRLQAHTNGIESFWSMLKRAHKGTFHKISPKHLDRYIQEFVGKHNTRDSGTLFQMRSTVAGLMGRNLLYRELVADNGLSSLARS
ncbi:MAG: IS1595 family transposase [Candidatus Dadabacteria bacterium]|nr:IS1595 family transposase [Candidatus Dadabacteria bacterium]